MKKILIRILIVLVVLGLLAVLALRLFLDSAIKKGIETAGPALTKVEVKLDKVGLSLLSGSGHVDGLFVGNPQGFKTPSAIKVGSASLALKPGSLLSDKIVIRSINVQGPEITFETDLKQNNLSKILANVQEATGGSQQVAQPATKKEEKAANRKLQVDEFVIAGAKVNVSITSLGGKSATVTIPEIRLKDLGQGPEGITAAELTKKVLAAIEQEAAKSSSSAVADLGKQATDIAKGVTKDLSQNASGAVSNATKSLGGLSDLLKKK